MLACVSTPVALWRAPFGPDVLNAYITQQLAPAAYALLGGFVYCAIAWMAWQLMQKK